MNACRLPMLSPSWLLVAAATLAGCQTYDDGPPKAAEIKAASAPCAQPAGQSYPEPPIPLNDVEFGTSPKARRERQNGCAGVRFQIGKDGSVRDAVLMVEAPAGYGFGQATLDGLAQTRYDPAAKPTLYYYTSVFLPRPPPPVRPPPGP